MSVCFSYRTGSRTRSVSAPACMKAPCRCLGWPFRRVMFRLRPTKNREGETGICLICWCFGLCYGSMLTAARAFDTLCAVKRLTAAQGFVCVVGWWVEVRNLARCECGCVSERGYIFVNGWLMFGLCSRLGRSLASRSLFFCFLPW